MLVPAQISFHVFIQSSFGSFITASLACIQFAKMLTLKRLLLVPAVALAFSENKDFEKEPLPPAPQESHIAGI